MRPSTGESWKGTLAVYAHPDERRGVRQLALTVLLLLCGYASMYLMLGVFVFASLLLAVPTSLLQVRLFILLHDMAHGSLFRSRRINDALGDIVGVLCFTPYRQWRRRHLIHHATSGNLSRRGWWEIPTATVEEYRSMSRRDAAVYRLTRSPLLLVTIGAMTFFLVAQRLPVPGQRGRERVSLWGTNLALAGVAAGVIALVGWQAAIIVWLPVAVLSSSIGMWLFYVQHQFEDAYWQSSNSWSFYDAAMRGSSLLTMPPVISWFFTGIGVHHIHHLNPRVPNYRLQPAHDENPEFHGVTTMSLTSSWRSVHANVWDGTRMVSFREARARTATVPAFTSSGSTDSRAS